MNRINSEIAKPMLLNTKSNKLVLSFWVYERLAEINSKLGNKVKSRLIKPNPIGPPLWYIVRIVYGKKYTLINIIIDPKVLFRAIILGDISKLLK